jgi:hypothetical protein
MTQKEILEALWEDTVVRCPLHIVWWSATTLERKHTEPVTGELAPEQIYYTKGRRVDLR